MGEIEPALADHVTLVFQAPVTLATNCCDCSGPSVDVAGETERLTAGTRLMVAGPVLPSAMLVAVTVAVCAVRMVAGAV